MRYVFGDYLLDTQYHELSRAGEPIPLRPKVFQLLAYLLAHRDRVVRKQELLDHLWPGQSVADTALNSYIMAVKAIGDHRPAPQLLRTVRGYGYRFAAPVQARAVPACGHTVVRTPLRRTGPRACTPLSPSPCRDQRGRRQHRS
jgi:DNA-binding winged helix-turn-helix (wHTH) protein